MRIKDIKPGMVLARHRRDTIVVLRTCVDDGNCVVDAYVLDVYTWIRRLLFIGRHVDMVEITLDFLTEKVVKQLPHEAMLLVMARQKERKS